MTGLPARLGRYEILGELAVGGMAEILLARVVGPSGFERPVVVKRILPHLARQETFVSMFLDEARIAASIRHHNVIHVEELHRDDDGLYLVMEYLEGESAAGLTRRLFLRDEPLDRVLAAHIVAESAAGLHAAHELTDPDGRSQELVHRDVSPQNLFVTYDGQVKVIDFGVAKSADRITRTEAGQIKGKFEYMSPEQCSGRPLDRRSDVFALGVVLYELSTGRRLFKRDSPAESVRAITDHDVVPPSRFHAAYPAALEHVVLRALAKSPTDRYATMLDMRRDLVAFLHDAGPTTELTDALARLMHEVFADRVAEKKEILRRVRSGSNVTHVPAGEIDEGVELARMVDPHLAPATTVDRSRSSSADEVDAPAPRPHPRRLVVALAAFGLLLAGIAAAGMVLARGPSPADPMGAARANADAGSDPTAASRGTSDDGGALATTSGAGPGDAAGEVVVHVESTPTKSVVSLDGTDLGTTPLDVRLPRTDASVALVLRHAHYVTTTERIIPDDDQRIAIELPLVGGPRATVGSGQKPGPASSPWSKWH